MTIYEFIHDLALRFSEGDLANGAAMFDVPVDIHIDDLLLHARTHDEVEAAYRTFRDNLLVESFDHTKVSIDYISANVNDRVQVLGTWTNLNRRGAVINVCEASYLLRPSQTSHWKVVKIDYITSVVPRLVQGIELAHANKV